jgi:hypothetical protein
MKRSIARAWAAALDSGQYIQGTGQLREKYRNPHEKTTNTFCCLGVLCNMHAQEHPEIARLETDPTEYLGESGLLPTEVMDWAGMIGDGGEFGFGSKASVDSLVAANDDAGMDFKQIAKLIRKEWKNL